MLVISQSSVQVKMSVRILSPELKEKAKKELNEDVERVEEDLKHIKDWLKKQPHLKARTDDQWLLAFLRGCKFSLERTKEKLDFFYTLKSMLPEIFANRDPMLPEIQEILKLGMFIPLPNNNPIEPSVILLRAGLLDFSKSTHLDMLKCNMMLMDLALLYSDENIINGVHVVQDLSQMTIKHIMQPATGKKAMTIIQNMYPNRLKGVHCVNLPHFFEAAYEIVKPFLTDKMKQRLHVCTNTEDLFKILPKHMFPEEYGGNAGKIEDIAAVVRKTLEDHRDWFIEDAKYGCDETKRPGRPKTADELFGIEGSFRKLNVD